jgi:outer membrane protein TolC
LMSVLTLAGETRNAYVLAVAAQESVRALQQVKAAALAGAELAERLQQVGNINKLQLAREQLFAQDAALNLARAEQTQAATREQLTRALGLWGEQARLLAQRLPANLPDLPAAPLEQADIEQSAMAQRLDVQAARQAALQTAHNLGLTRSTRFVNVLELGLLRSTSNELPSQRGWEVSVELPLFDGGGARVAKAEAVYAQSLHQAAFVAINARSEVRQAYLAYRSAYDIARFHVEQMLPLRQRVLDESGLRYNGMLIGVFELLADAREQVNSLYAALAAKRDFWLAQANLDQALIGRAELPSMVDTAAPAAARAGGH